MDIRCRSYWLGVLAIGALAAGNALELSRARNGRIGTAINGAIIVISLAAMVQVAVISRRRARHGVLLRIGEDGVEVRPGAAATRIPWQEIRQAGRARSGPTAQSGLMSRIRGLAPPDVTLLGRLDLEHEDVLPDLLDFYARNEALRGELGSPALVGERMRRLRGRSKRRLRVLERKAGTVRVRRPVTERSP